MKFVTAALVAATFLLTSCATTSRSIDGLNMNYLQVKSFVTNHIPGGVKSQSRNGRTVTSNSFDLDKLQPSTVTTQSRGYAVVTILNSTRPYNLKVEAFREPASNSPSTHARADASRDLEVTTKVQEFLKQALVNRRGDRNTIDDFRAY